MSRRRDKDGRVSRAPSAFPTGNRRKDAAPTETDLYAGVSIVDPAGHRLLEVGRHFREPDPIDTWWDVKTLGPSVRFTVESDDAGSWTVLWFDCKTCRDQGRAQTTHIAYDAVESAVTTLWDASAASGVPSHMEVTTDM